MLTEKLHWLMNIVSRSRRSIWLGRIHRFSPKSSLSVSLRSTRLLINGLFPQLNVFRNETSENFTLSDKDNWWIHSNRLYQLCFLWSALFACNVHKWENSGNVFDEIHATCTCTMLIFCHNDHFYISSVCQFICVHRCIFFISFETWRNK